LKKLVKAGVRELSLGLETRDGKHSIATVACLTDRPVDERCLPDAGLADHQQRGTVLYRSSEGSLELSNLGIAPDQPRRHATKIREPGV
jgi:hypothetical protein